MTALNPQSPMPLYRQLADHLLDRIRTGEFPLGSKIPSEPELARTFGIGRPTVRQATDRLIQQRRLERRRGSGTFVVEPPEEVDLFTLAGTMASFRKGGIEVRTQLVRRPHKIHVDGDTENPFTGREAFFFSRLSRVRGTPVLLEEFHLDPAHFPDLGRISLAGRSLAQLADEHYHMRPTSADQNFRVGLPGGERAELLELGKRECALIVKRALHFPHARSAIYSELFCRTDQLVFSQKLGDNGDG